MEGSRKSVSEIKIDITTTHSGRVGVGEINREEVSPRVV